MKQDLAGHGQAFRPPRLPHKLEELGYELGDNQFEDAFVRFKELADRKKHVYDEDIEALVDEEIAHAHDRIKLVCAHGHRRHHAGRSRRPSRSTSRAGTTPCRPTGNGPVDATFNAIKALDPARGGAGALSGARGDGGNGCAGRGFGAACRGRQGGDGQGADPDTLVASAKAYLGALNKLMVRRQKDRPDADRPDALISGRRIHSTDAG